jgi:hypothetical protein
MRNAEMEIRSMNVELISLAQEVINDRNLKESELYEIESIAKLQSKADG